MKLERRKIFDNFYADEFVSPESYVNGINNGLGEIDPKLIISIELIRVILDKPVFVNTWWDEFEKQVKNGISIKKVIKSKKLKTCNSGDGFLLTIGIKPTKRDLNSAISKLLRNKDELFSIGLRNAKIIDNKLYIDAVGETINIQK